MPYLFGYWDTCQGYVYTPWQSYRYYSFNLLILLRLLLYNDSRLPLGNGNVY